jgi:hypothetical protein
MAARVGLCVIHARTRKQSWLDIPIEHRLDSSGLLENGG